VSDIFQEVDEELRRERLKQLWDRYGNMVVALALLIVVGIGGWRGYQWWEAKQAAEHGAAFETALALSAEGKQSEAEAAFARIAAEGTPGYRTLARFREAGELVQRDPQGAVKLYDALAADPGVRAVLQDLAKVRAGLVLLDTAPLGDLRSRLEPLTASGRAFRHSAREILAFAAWRAGDTAAAREWSDMMLADAETPAGARTRIDMLKGLTAPAAKS
jgi:hypothetical protein